ncbi:hypothetical protein ACA910_002081 [Epithemia clementina (nom. ined.)]
MGVFKPASKKKSNVLLLFLATTAIVTVDFCWAWAPPNRVIHVASPKLFYHQEQPQRHHGGTTRRSSTENRLTRTRLTSSPASRSSMFSPSLKSTTSTLSASVLPLTRKARDYNYHHHHYDATSIYRVRKNKYKPMTSAIQTKNDTEGQKKEKQQQETNGMNRVMMKRMVLSQVALLGLASALALGVTTVFGHPFMDSLQWLPQAEPQFLLIPSAEFGGSNIWLSRILLGVMAATPMILITQGVDQSASIRDASHVHFATTNMVVALFGRRQRPQQRGQLQLQQASNLKNPVMEPAVDRSSSASNGATTSSSQVFWSSAALSALTSATEEIVFRGYVPSLILAVTQMPAIAWLGQAILFGLCHIHPAAQAGENRIVAATQTWNAVFGYGLVYAVSGGDLWPCIVVHVLLDMHVLVASWHKVNTQMDWTEDSLLARQEDRSSMTTAAATTTTTTSNTRHGDLSALQLLQEWAGPALSLETLNTCRRFFYAFDEDHKHALSLPNVQRAISYAFLQDSKQPSTRQVERLFYKVLKERTSKIPQEQHAWEDRIDLAEFVRLLFSIRAQTFKMTAASTQSTPN